ncbi:MAG: L,D-transpeptidase [Methylovirgula sp.]
MAKRFVLLIGFLVLGPHAALAGSYGGGFLEFLLTGSDPQSPAAAVDTVRQAAKEAQVPSAGSAAATEAESPVPPSSYSALAEPGASQPQPAINPIYFRQEVDYRGPEKPGTIIIDTPNRFLFLVEKGDKALRYGIGVGRPGFEWAGVKTISRKAEWPAWTPPSDMLKRRPDLPRHMAGGPDNPLGARALYLGSSLYRIHGTNQPWTIGANVSSGCIRMMNDDVIDLYNHVRVGTKVVVM